MNSSGKIVKIKLNPKNYTTMLFAFFIFTRLLFIACMVFIIGHVFGNFSKNRNLRRTARVATIVTIVLFFSTNAFIKRGAWGEQHRGAHDQEWCGYHEKDSTVIHQGHFGKSLKP